MFACARPVILAEDLPRAFDRRAWREACALRDAGCVVSITCPTGRGEAMSRAEPEIET